MASSTRLKPTMRVPMSAARRSRALERRPATSAQALASSHAITAWRATCAPIGDAEGGGDDRRGGARATFVREALRELVALAGGEDDGGAHGVAGDELAEARVRDAGADAGDAAVGGVDHAAEVGAGAEEDRAPFLDGDLGAGE